VSLLVEEFSHHRKVNVIKSLIEAGSDINVADISGATPLTLARQKGFGDVAELLTRELSRRRGA